MTFTPPTNLRLDPIGIPPYSARGISQTLTPLSQAAFMRRNVNGQLRDLSVEQMRLYGSTISCTDQQQPALSGVWPGRILVVDCIVELSYKTVGGSPERPVVEGSEHVVGDFTYYRPRLTMMVTSYDDNFDEYACAAGWSLALEELEP